MRKKSFGRHSERSEESLLIPNKSLREILRAKSALRMTVLGLFQQPAKGAPAFPWREANLLYVSRSYSSGVAPSSYAGWSTFAGSERVTTAPPAGLSEILAVPPCDRTIASTKASPNPCPCECFPLTKRSNARVLMSGGNPGPLSSISSFADPSCDRSRIVIWHPKGK